MPTIPIPKVGERFHTSIYGEGKHEDSVMGSAYFRIAEVGKQLEDDTTGIVWEVLVEEKNCWYEVHWDFNKARWEADPE